MGPEEGSLDAGRRGSAPEFRAEAVELYRISDKLIRDIASEVGISSEWLRRWVTQTGDRQRQAQGSHHRRPRGAGPPMQGEPPPSRWAPLHRVHQLPPEGALAAGLGMVGARVLGADPEAKELGLDRP